MLSLISWIIEFSWHLNITALCGTVCVWNRITAPHQRCGDIIYFLTEITMEICHYIHTMMTSSNGNIFHVTGPLCGEFTRPGDSPHKGQWRGALMFSLICARMSDWVNNREAGDLRRHRGHYDVSVMHLRICKLKTYLDRSPGVAKNSRRPSNGRPALWHVLMCEHIDK